MSTRFLAPGVCALGGLIVAFAPCLVAANVPTASVPAVPVVPGLQTPQDRPPLLKPGTPAPDFSVDKYPDNSPLKLSDFKGKIVVLDFWATWCPPCRAAMPHLEQVWQQVRKQDVVVLAVCVSDTREAYNNWVPELAELTFQFAFDPAGRDASKPNISRGLYNVSGIPTTYIIGRDGKVVDAVVGYGGEKDTRLDSALKKLGIKLEAPARRNSSSSEIH